MLISERSPREMLVKPSGSVRCGSSPVRLYKLKHSFGEPHHFAKSIQAFDGHANPLGTGRVISFAKSELGFCMGESVRSTWSTICVDSARAVNMVLFHNVADKVSLYALLFR